MKIKTLLLALGIFMSQLASYAQKKEFKFGKITAEDFQAKPVGPDSAAAAIKLFDLGECYFEINPSTGGFGYVFERHIRYKIMNKNGYDLANYQIALYKGSGSSKEDLYKMEAATYNMVDGKMVTSKPNKDAKFTEEFNKNYTYKKFALPNVKEGSVIEYKYVIKSDFLFNLRGWSFQSDVPTVYTEYNVKIPEYLSYKTNFSGILLVNHTKQENITANYVSGVASTAVHNQYTLENVPALKSEAYITTLDDYRPRVEFELRSTHFPNQMMKDFNSTWPTIIKDLAEDEKFGGFINKNAYAKSILPTLLKGEKDTLAMAQLIFNHVKNNLKWNNNEYFYADQNNPKVAFEKKTVNTASINLSLVSLLKEAKIEAYPFLLSTRSNGAHPGYPVISKFDNVLAHVVIGNKDILLDATDEDLPFGMIAFNNLNHQGLSINFKTLNGRWLATEPTVLNEKIFSLNLKLDEAHKFTGRMDQYSRGYSALNLRDRYKSKNNEVEFLKDFKKEKTGLEITNYKIDNLDKLDELLTETMNVVIEDQVEEAGNLVYFNPLMYERTKENLFKQDKRAFPVDFGYPFKETYRITVAFPESYEVDKLPKGAIYKLPDNKGSFTISFFAEGKTLMVRSIIDLTKSVYTPEEYFDLKELFKTIVDKQAEQIVFKKKA